MSTIAAIRARLAALASARIDWPAGDGIETMGDPTRGWDGPYLAGTWLHVADAGRNLAEHWEDCRPWYHDRTDAECRAMRDYYVAQRDLFLAAAWRWALTSTATAPGEDGARLLRADIATLLAETARLRAVEEAARVVVADDHRMRSVHRHWEALYEALGVPRGTEAERWAAGAAGEEGVVVSGITVAHRRAHAPDARPARDAGRDGRGDR